MQYLNLAVCLMVALLIITSTRRTYIGWLVLSYYIIFIVISHLMIGLSIEWTVTNDEHINYDIACLILCALISIIATHFFYKGSALAGLYSLWLIYNATLCFIGTISGYNEFYFDLLYTVTQNLNLFVDLSVVLLGTDNYFHNRDRKIGRIIYRTNNCINSLCDKITHLLAGAKKI